VAQAFDDLQLTPDQRRAVRRAVAAMTGTRGHLAS
jgi:hypothetical protein